MLVEVIVALDTSASALDTAEQLMGEIDKETHLRDYVVADRHCGAVLQVLTSGIVHERR
jgi:3-hydroxyacyl-CoA dehydrogenase